MRSAPRSDVVKRLFDLVVASTSLVLLSPVIAGIALALRLHQGPPVLFRQLRPGLRGEPFTIFKFRTMGTTDGRDADGDGPVGEPRVTRLGRWLRSTSLDELPELWNVVKGDMSLVGPRPLLMDYLPRFTPEQGRRHEVRPGITGLAQVSGRNGITWEQKFALDLRYVDEHDLRMDLDILLRTVGTVLSRDGIRHSDQEDMPEFLGTGALGAPSGQER
jgi:lipopolysaccharide/colanic/teichoic acid biosynthesis glycosyltransferase